MLIIEVDGITHTTDEAIEKDRQRDIILLEIGFKVFRFASWEVLNRMVDVDVSLTKWLLDNNFYKLE